MHIEGQNLIRGHNVSTTCMNILFHLTEQNKKHQPACMIQFDQHNWLNQLTMHPTNRPHASDWLVLRLLCLFFNNNTYEASKKLIYMQKRGSELFFKF